MDVRIEFRDRQLRAALARLVSAGEDFSPATREIAGLLRRITERAFEAEKDPATGEAWATLSDVTASRPRNRSGRPRGYDNKLRVHGDLLASIIPDHDKTSAILGTNLIYAATQHFGAKHEEFGRGSYKTRAGGFPIPWGDIPARPFFGVSPADETDIASIIARHIGASWSRG